MSIKNEILKLWIEEYIKLLNDELDYVKHQEVYKWQAFDHFNQHWDDNVGSDKIYEQIQQSFAKAANLLSGSHFLPLKMMLEFAEREPDAVVKMFIKLYDESQKLDVRLSYFEQESIRILDTHWEDKTLSHYQSDRAMMVYLAMRYPSRYYLYKNQMCNSFCSKTGFSEPLGRGTSSNFKIIDDFQHLCNTTRQVLIQNSQLLEAFDHFITSKVKINLNDNYHLLTQDFMFATAELLQLDENKSQNRIEMENTMKPGYKSPLNQILYGAPGTGKTYSTIKKAVAIIEGVKKEDLDGDYDAIKARYDEYCKKGQVVFTTFHQSTCYEDFIEGIKPKVNDEENVIYEIEDGLFKKIAFKAGFSIIKEKDSSKADEILDFSLAFDNFKQLVEDKLELGGYIEISTKNGATMNINGVSTQGNLIVSHSDKNNVYTASKERLVRLNSAFPDLSAVNNIDREFRSVIGGSNSTANWAVLNAIRSDQSLWQNQDIIDATYSDEDIKQAFEQASYDVSSSGGQAYVIIIDEINRGNVSQIFGELITLLEENKRLGNKEQLQITLPYSKKKFGVPNNLYIIGTMNTADRSVEALDTALRRRFQFVEMSPKPEVIEKVNGQRDCAGIDLVKLLSTINDRIEVLLDRDHCIGHSYFLNLKNLDDLKVAFSKQIIPLLQEYFYGDYGKIALVLGEGFCEAKVIENASSLFASVTSYDSEVYDDKQIYELTNPLEMGDSEFEKAIASLYNEKTLNEE